MENFNDIAQDILNGKVLRVKDKIFRICEIEFYLHSEEHPDEYVHQSPDQLKNGSFYFHRYKNGAYKSGTYKGLDITFGDEEKKIYFGVLIRSIREVASEDLEAVNPVIEGPCRSVNKILELYDCKSVDEFTDGVTLNIDNNFRNFVLETRETKDEDKILVGPRIGLSNKYPEYKDKPYRYVLAGQGIKKEAKSLKN